LGAPSAMPQNTTHVLGAPATVRDPEPSPEEKILAKTRHKPLLADFTHMEIQIRATLETRATLAGEGEEIQLGLEDGDAHGKGALLAECLCVRPPTL
jgi:hypothetical protein